MNAYVKIFDKNGLPLGFAPFERKIMTINPSLPVSVEGATDDSPLVVTISNVKAEPSSLKISRNMGLSHYEIYGLEDRADIDGEAWILLKAPVYANGEVTFSLIDNHAKGSLTMVEITVNGKTTTFQ